jgi:hypothetical protein
MPGLARGRHKRSPPQHLTLTALAAAYSFVGFEADMRRLRVNYVGQYKLDAQSTQFPFVGADAMLSAGNTDADFIYRITRPGVTNYFDCSTLGVVRTAHEDICYETGAGVPYWPLYPQVTAEDQALFQANPGSPNLDFSVKASGASSVHMSFPNGSGSGGGGSFIVNASANGAPSFGPGETFYFQWRERFDDTFLDTPCTMVNPTTQLSVGPNPPGDLTPPAAVTSHKQVIISAIGENSAANSSLIVTSNGAQGFPIMYQEFNMTGGKAVTLSEHTPSGENPPYGSDSMLQPSRPSPFCTFLEYSSRSSTLPDYYTYSPPGCWTYVANEWATYQCSITVGVYALSGSQGTSPAFRFMRVRLWAAHEGQASQQLLDWTGDVPWTTSPFATLWFTGYMTAKDWRQQHATMNHWFDEVIVSRQPIPDPIVRTLPPQSAPSELRSYVSMYDYTKGGGVRWQLSRTQFRPGGTDRKVFYGNSVAQYWDNVTYGSGFYADMTTQKLRVYAADTGTYKEWNSSTDAWVELASELANLPAGKVRLLGNAVGSSGLNYATRSEYGMFVADPARSRILWMAGGGHTGGYANDAGSFIGTAPCNLLYPADPESLVWNTNNTFEQNGGLIDANGAHPIYASSRHIMAVHTFLSCRVIGNNYYMLSNGGAGGTAAMPLRIDLTGATYTATPIPATYPWYYCASTAYDATSNKVIVFASRGDSIGYRRVYLFDVATETISASYLTVAAPGTGSPGWCGNSSNPPDTGYIAGTDRWITVDLCGTTCEFILDRNNFANSQYNRLTVTGTPCTLGVEDVNRFITIGGSAPALWGFVHGGYIHRYDVNSRVWSQIQMQFENGTNCTSTMKFGLLEYHAASGCVIFIDRANGNALAYRPASA